MTALAFVFYLLGAVIVAVTILPIWQTSHWWVRLCDFPRYQVAVLALIVLVLMPLTLGPLTASELCLFIAVAIAALWQVSWIWRYMPGAPLEVPSSAAVPSGTGRIALLTTNVFQDCRDAGALLQIIGDADPDLILAVETDEWWCSRLSEALRTRYQYGLTYPLSNGYGMAMFSRLELLQPTIRFLVDDAIPSIKTGVRLRSGAVIDLYGLHPQPPAPLQDSPSVTLSWSSWELKLRVLGVLPWCLAISMMLPGHQRRPSSREPETCATRGGDEASSIPTLRASLVFDIHSTTSSTPNIFPSARCEFFRKQAPTIFR